MSKWIKFWERLEGAQADNNIDFAELIYYLERLGWELFSRGTSHRVYKHLLVPVAVNIQPRWDGKAKSYQVAQVRDALAQYTGDDKDGWLRGQSLLQSE